mgnify:FL=1|tara:strand:- start:172 stop:723 length:552 start_codon:yes stop_codon:yes gene_type:complete
MAFKDNTLEFSDTQIFDVQSGIEVMMFWEVPIMRKAAEYISHNNGDVLEIGFGMGICADYIQEQGVNSHTIIEIHPQILEKLSDWASNKSNVTIIEGDWANLSLTDTYDGIFLDTFGDNNLNSFKTFALERIKSGGKITYWNNEPSENNKYAFDSISYEQINVTPNENTYFNSNIYYMPKVTV